MDQRILPGLKVRSCFSKEPEPFIAPHRPRRSNSRKILFQAVPLEFHAVFLTVARCDVGANKLGGKGDAQRSHRRARETEEESRRLDIYIRQRRPIGCTAGGTSHAHFSSLRPDSTGRMCHAWHARHMMREGPAREHLILNVYALTADLWPVYPRQGRWYRRSDERPSPI